MAPSILILWFLGFWLRRKNLCCLMLYATARLLNKPDSSWIRRIFPSSVPRQRPKINKTVSCNTILIESWCICKKLRLFFLLSHSVQKPPEQTKKSICWTSPHLGGPIMPSLICPLKECFQQGAQIVSKARVEANVNCSQTSALRARSIRRRRRLLLRCPRLARKHLVLREICCCWPAVSNPVPKYLT